MEAYWEEVGREESGGRQEAGCDGILPVRCVLKVPLKLRKGGVSRGQRG